MFSRFSGHSAGLLALKSRRKPCVLSRFSRFSLPFEFRRFLVRFFEKVAKTTRFTASFGPRGRGSASVFSPFLHARFVKKCSKPRAFARYSRFLGLATDFWFCCVRFNSLLFDFRKPLQNPRVFARIFTRGREPCGCFRIFFGCFRDFFQPPRGFSRPKSRRKPCVLSRFSRFRFSSNLKVFSFAFSKKLRKPCVLQRFSGREAAVPRPFFRRFCTLAL